MHGLDFLEILCDCQTNLLFTKQLPPAGDLWSYYVDYEARRMDTWEKIVPSFKFNPETSFFEMLVPTVDTVRFGYLLDKLLSVRRSVLYTGTTGVGKVHCGVDQTIYLLFVKHLRNMSDPIKSTEL